MKDIFIALEEPPFWRGLSPAPHSPSWQRGQGPSARGANCQGQGATPGTLTRSR